MPPRPSNLKTPSRRMTLGGAPTTRTNRRMSIDTNSGIPTSAVKGSRPPMGRKSMIPRVGGGRENAPPLPPAAPSTPRVPASPRVPSSPGVLAPTAASSRRSMGGATISRRQSIVPSVPKIPDDPRPITDKAFQLKAIKALLNFLKEFNYPHAVTQKSLSKPSSKEFNQILTFMLRLTDANFQVESNMKFEDEVCLQFKCLGYPFTISKTSLAAAGSPHTWPTLLAALAWLSEHLMRTRSDRSDDFLWSDQAFESLDELQIHTEKAFFQYLLLSYQAFMQGDTARINQLELALQKRFDDDDKLLEHEVNRIDDLNATILERINMLRQDAGNLSEWKKKRDEYLVDLEQFQDLSKTMENHKKSLQQKKIDLEKELSGTSDKLDRMTNHIADMKRAIETQELSASDVLKLEIESKSAIEAMQRLQLAKEKRENELLVIEEELQERAASCEAVMDQLNTKLNNLRTFSDFLEPFKTYKFTLNKDHLLGSDPVQAFGVDCRESLVPAVSHASQHLSIKKANVEEEVQSAFDRLDETSGASDQALSVKQIVLDKITECNDSLQREQEAHDSRMAVREREAEALARKVEARRDPMELEEQMAIMERELAELEALRAKHEAENVQSKKAVMQEIDSACALMMEHEYYLQNKMKHVGDYREEKMAKAVTMVAPAGVADDEQY